MNGRPEGRTFRKDEKVMITTNFNKKGVVFMATTEYFTLQFGEQNKQLKKRIIVFTIVPALLGMVALLHWSVWAILYVAATAGAAYLTVSHGDRILGNNTISAWRYTLPFAIIATGIAGFLVGVANSASITGILQWLSIDSPLGWTIAFTSIALLVYGMLCKIGYRETAITIFCLVLFTISVGLVSGFNKNHLPVKPVVNQQQVQEACRQTDELFPAQCT